MTPLRDDYAGKLRLHIRNNFLPSATVADHGFEIDWDTETVRVNVNQIMRHTSMSRRQVHLALLDLEATPLLRQLGKTNLPLNISFSQLREFR